MTFIVYFIPVMVFDYRLDEEELVPDHLLLLADHDRHRILPAPPNQIRLQCHFSTILGHRRRRRRPECRLIHQCPQFGP